MMKRSKFWIIIVLLLAGTLLVVNQLAGQGAKKETEIEAEKETETETNAPKESIVDSNVYPGLNIKTETKETNLFTMSVSQPYTASEQVNQPIVDWIDAQRKEFTANVIESESFLDENNFRAHLNIQADTEEIAEKIYTLEFNSYQITGGANGVTKMKPFVIDLNENKHVHINDIFQLDQESIKAIKKLVLEGIYHEANIHDGLSEDRVNEALKDPNKWKWSISRDDVTFYFDKYEVAAGVVGALRVELPIEKFKPYLKREFANKLAVELPEEEEDIEEEEPLAEPETLDPNGKYIALTFDDGPHPDVTPGILKTLKKHQVKATFFMLGSQVEYYPNLASDVMEAGHEIGNHTMNHQDLTVLHPHEIREEIEQSSDLIERATGQKPTLLRPPYGALNDQVKQLANELKLSMIMWSVDSIDWQSREAMAVHEEVMTDVVPGAIVLLHDIHPSTAEALPLLLNSLKEQDYEFVTVSQLLELWDDHSMGPHYGSRG